MTMGMESIDGGLCQGDLPVSGAYMFSEEKSKRSYEAWTMLSLPITIQYTKHTSRPERMNLHKRCKGHLQKGEQRYFSNCNEETNVILETTEYHVQ